MTKTHPVVIGHPNDSGDLKSISLLNVKIKIHGVRDYDSPLYFLNVFYIYTLIHTPPPWYKQKHEVYYQDWLFETNVCNILFNASI